MNLQELAGFLNDHQPFHSDLQMDRFITVAHGGTLYGCYRQALRELRTRFDALKDDHYRIESAKLKIEEIEQDADWALSELKARRRDLEIKKIRMDLEQLETTAADRAREFSRFYAQAKDLKKKLGVLTPERRVEYEAEFWEHKIKCMAAMDYLRGGPLSTGVFEMVHALPPAFRARLMPKLLPPEAPALIAWWSDTSPGMAEADAITESTDTPAEIRALLCQSPSPLTLLA